MSPHHKYSPVAVSVDAPQLHIGLGSNCGRPWGAVYQGQFAEAASFPDTGHPLIVHIHLWEKQGRHQLNSNINLQYNCKYKHNIFVSVLTFLSESQRRGSDTHIHLPLVDYIEIVTFITWVHTTTALASHKRHAMIRTNVSSAKLRRGVVLTLQNNGFSSDVSDWKHCIKYVTGKKEIFKVMSWTQSRNYHNYL